MKNVVICVNHSKSNSYFNRINGIFGFEKVQSHLPPCVFSAGIELSLEWIEERVSRLFGKQPSKDPEDPAALVGSFKRYK